MRKALVVAALVAAAVIVTWQVARRPARDPSSVVRATILQVNDVYEIMPVGGDLGGLARVATLRKQLAAENPNTYMVLAGDVFSPSALGTAKAGPGGTALNGRQMVDVMNLAGLNYATFGNHEFDLSPTEFEQRLKESSFRWVSSNVHAADGTPFMNVAPNLVITAANPSGRQLRIGLFGLTIDSNTAKWVGYDKPVETARRQFESLKGNSDAVVALTHLEFDEDEAVAQALPGLSMIIGGHEHLNVLARRGGGTVPIAKADANAKSVYIHRLRYDTGTRKLSIDSEWKAINADIPDDPGVKAVVDRWRDAAFTAFRADGFDPPKQVTVLPVPLDGREETTRTGSTNLTDLISSAMLEAFPHTDAAIFNSGSIRIDDQLPAAPLTQYDVLRILPYPGDIMVARVSGAMLARIISVGHDAAHTGSGAYLQAGGLGRATPDPKRSYRVVMNDFLLSGKETGLDFVGQRGPAIQIEPDLPKELRHVVIARLARGL